MDPTRPRRLLMAAGTGIAATVFSIGAMLGLREDRDGLLRYLLLAAAMLLVAGQLFPRALARRFATPLVPMLMPALRVLDWLCTPLLAFAAAMVAPITRRFNAPEESRGSLEELLREGEIEGVGEPAESAIISGVVEFGAKHAGEVMTPRADIVAVERAMAAADITGLVAQSKYSRIPVYDGTLDHVMGLVHSFDVLARPDAPVSVLRKVSMSRADAPCDELMRRMLRDRVHLAIIHDGAGNTLGLVTLEDLVEELVGEIRDEHDDPQPTAV
jgi:putative hemolysin